MKKKLSAILYIFMLIITVAALVTASFAWMSMNTQTQTEGMQLNVDVSPNLIINSSSSALQSVDNPSASDFSVTFNNAAAAIMPATHSSGSATGLVCVTNTSNVNANTGLAREGSLTFGEAGTDHYVDYTVYIASSGKAMSGMDLNAVLSPPASILGSGASKQDTLDASSIDFYLGSVSQQNFKGTLNVKGYDASLNNHSTLKNSVALLSNGAIPFNQSGYLTIIMRCYVDGALLKDATHAFINSENVVTDAITMNVFFSATESV